MFSCTLAWSLAVISLLVHALKMTNEEAAETGNRACQRDKQQQTLAMRTVLAAQASCGVRSAPNFTSVPKTLYRAATIDYLEGRQVLTTCVGCTGQQLRPRRSSS